VAATAQLQVRRRPGRPRDEDLEQLVLDAALEKIDEVQEMTVSKLVERSGVSRAAIYRRWPSMPLPIVSALNTGRVVPPVISLEGDLGAEPRRGAPWPRGGANRGDVFWSRFSQRIRLVMADRELQLAYRQSHVKLD